MKFEKQLATIKTKAELHAWIDTLEDDAIGLIIVGVGEVTDNFHYRFHEIGEQTIAQSHYIACSFANYLMGNCE